MLSSGIFPARLKFAEIKPIYKQGAKSNTSNYRPVSLLTSFSHIFDRIILYHHINDNHILVDEQFGFRQSSSTDMATYALTNSILTTLNNKLLVGGIFCELQKAFDCVNHDIMLSKIEFCGVSGKSNTLMKSY